MPPSFPAPVESSTTYTESTLYFRIIVKNAATAQFVMRTSKIYSAFDALNIREAIDDGYKKQAEELSAYTVDVLRVTEIVTGEILTGDQLFTLTDEVVPAQEASSK